MYLLFVPRQEGLTLGKKKTRFLWLLIAPHYASLICGTCCCEVAGDLVSLASLRVGFAAAVDRETFFLATLQQKPWKGWPMVALGASNPWSRVVAHAISGHEGCTNPATSPHLGRGNPPFRKQRSRTSSKPAGRIFWLCQNRDPAAL